MGLTGLGAGPHGNLAEAADVTGERDFAGFAEES